MEMEKYQDVSCISEKFYWGNGLDPRPRRSKIHVVNNLSAPNTSPRQSFKVSLARQAIQIQQEDEHELSEDRLLCID